MTKREKKQALKSRLNLYRDLEREKAQISQELARIEWDMRGVRAANMDGMPKGSSSGDPVLDIVSRHLALKDKYMRLLEELSDAQADIEDLITKLHPRMRVLMRLRYIQGLQWEEVCVAVGYSWAQTHREHAKALDAILETMKDKEQED